MRIVGGKFKGRNLMTFKGDAIRPTADKVRESLFNIFQFKIQDSDFLDLFCGTGAVGIEAISRGANKVVFNDLNKDSIELTQKNLSLIKNPSNAVVKRSDGVDFLKCNTEKFDIIFIDPPYKSGLYGQLLTYSHLSLKEGGTVVFESEEPLKEEDYNAVNLSKYDERKYGRAHLTFFKKVK